MENPKILRRILLRTLVAAALGAGLLDGMIVLVNIEDVMWHRGHVSDFWNGLFTLLAYALVFPSALLTTATGHKPGLINEYVLDGVLGALLFGLPTALYQVAKRYCYENQN